MLVILVFVGLLYSHSNYRKQSKTLTEEKTSLQAQVQEGKLRAKKLSAEVQAEKSGVTALQDQLAKLRQDTQADATSLREQITALQRENKKLSDPGVFTVIEPGTVELHFKDYAGQLVWLRALGNSDEIKSFELFSPSNSNMITSANGGTRLKVPEQSGAYLLKGNSTHPSGQYIIEGVSEHFDK